MLYVVNLKNKELKNIILKSKKRFKKEKIRKSIYFKREKEKNKNDIKKKSEYNSFNREKNYQLKDLLNINNMNNNLKKEKLKDNEYIKSKKLLRKKVAQRLINQI